MKEPMQMNELFQERRKELFILIGLILVLILTIYFLFIFPKYKEVDTKQTNIATVETNINKLKTDIKKETEEENRADTFKLRKKIPENEEIEKLLVKIEEIEGMSTSRVEAIGFTYQDGEEILQESEDETPIFKEKTIEDEEEIEEKEKDDEGAAREREEDEEETLDDSEEETVETTEEDEEAEAKLKTIEIELEVNSSDYLSFYTFISEIEKLERIVFVSELEFVKPAEEEIYFNDVYDGTITHKVHLQTFTYEDE